MIKAVIFDLDGTLLDTSEDLTDSVNYILQKNAYMQVSRKTVIQNTGNAARRLLKGCIGCIDDDKLDTILEEYKAYYTKHYCAKTKPYDGILELLQKLANQNIQVAVASNKPQEVTARLCEHFFPGMVCIGETPEMVKKPNPMMVNEAIRRLGVEKKDAVYIGDSEVDILTAINVGIPCISVSWGFRSKEELEKAGAQVIADSCSDLMRILLKNS